MRDIIRYNERGKHLSNEKIAYERVKKMNSVINKKVNAFYDYQCDFSFSFDQQDQGSFVLHTNTGNCLIV